MKWKNTKDEMPELFVSVLGVIQDTDPFPDVRECYFINAETKQAIFPALNEAHTIKYWADMPEPPEVKE